MLGPAAMQRGIPAMRGKPMPHMFIQVSPSSPNPGRLKRTHVEEICNRHKAKLEHYWHDDPANPTVGYILVEGGDINGLSADLDVRDVVTLHRPTE
jgi:hypothetical protein